MPRLCRKHFLCTSSARHRSKLFCMSIVVECERKVVEENENIYTCLNVGSHVNSESTTHSTVMSYPQSCNLRLAAPAMTANAADSCEMWQPFETIAPASDNTMPTTRSTARATSRAALVIEADGRYSTHHFQNLTCITADACTSRVPWGIKLARQSDHHTLARADPLPCECHASPQR